MGVAAWVQSTAAALANVTVDVEHTFASGSDVAVVWTFGGMVNVDGPLAAVVAGPNAGGTFAVPAASILKMRGERIASVGDYYNKVDLFLQVGIPADFQPPEMDLA